MSKKVIKELVPRLKMYSIVSFVIDLIIKLLYLIPPILMKVIVDEYIPSNNTNATLRTIVLFAIIPVIIAIFTTLYNYRVSVIGRNTGRKIASYDFRKLLNQPLSYFYDKNSVELAEYCSTNATEYTLLWITDIPKVCSSIIASVIAFAYILSLSSTGLGLLLYIPILLIPSFYLSKKAQKYIKKIIVNSGKSKQILSDTFKNIKFVKTMNLHKNLLSKIDSINKDTVSVWSKASAIENLNGTWIHSIVDNIFIGIVFAFTAIGVINGEYQLGTLIILLTYLPTVFYAVKLVATTNLNYKKRLAEFEKLFIILELTNEADVGTKEFSYTKQIKLENVSFSYVDGIKVLNDLDLTVSKGEWIGIVGKSGSGKTTLFDVLLRLLEIEKGSITIDEVSLYDIAYDDLVNGISRVAQNTFLFPGTIRENLLLVKEDATDDELNEAIRLSGLAEFIIGLSQGIDTNIGEDGITISGGQKQRIGLAKGLLKGAKILLLDEVTGNVDRENEMKMITSIHEVIKEKELTVISISHKPEFFKFADRVLKMENGKLVSVDI